VTLLYVYILDDFLTAKSGNDLKVFESDVSLPSIFTVSLFVFQVKMNKFHDNQDLLNSTG